MRVDDTDGHVPALGIRSQSRSELHLALALLMTSVAGFLDAVGFTHLAGLYVSFMSGNSTRLGIAIAQGDRQIFLPVALVIFSFVFGAFLGTLISEIVERFKCAAILAIEIGLLVSAIVLTRYVEGYLGLLPVCAAMGMQNAAHETVAGVEIGKSFVTGFLFGLGKALAQLVHGGGSRPQALVYGASWVSFLGGVTLGCLALAQFGLSIALCTACTVLAGLAIGAVLDQRRPLEPAPRSLPG
ncbi:Protein of unknown function DUF1275 [Rhodopseudomonas palustris HaA2]|uniref:DUF1275 domain-containing protein n=1 Tax=Rhodopseudomonas palustris (strain HaA2) TaxID=316058 RepID=Q2J3Q0_RHOP2|nr:YoaK family protein [Rhodopseudomonas palustris]ABD04910.1 Protein of unknown function DUF1275 [Rhodopseudomonas palustris HaA2]